jgi:hypothetical protein
MECTQGSLSSNPLYVNLPPTKNEHNRALSNAPDTGELKSTPTYYIQQLQRDKTRRAKKRPHESASVAEWQKVLDVLQYGPDPHKEPQIRYSPSLLQSQHSQYKTRLHQKGIAQGDPFSENTIL